MNVLVLHYTHPEGYPPTVNAIHSISKQVDKLIILSTDTLPTKWSYEENVELVLLKGNHNRFKHINRSKLAKIKSYFNYILKIVQLIKKEQIDLLIIYDSVPFLFYRLASNFFKINFKVWYHNHDVYPLSKYKKYSVNWLGAKSVQKHFNTVNFFSLPALERKKMFPLKTFKGKFFFIPNYPSKYFSKSSVAPIVADKQIKIVYPGTPSHKNGFKELIDAMIEPINTKTVSLTLTGEISPGFINEIKSYAKEKGVENQVFFDGRVPYSEISNYISQFHIGWALYKPVDLSVATAGSSSNKIYEFLANGLPIIVFDNEHHHEYFDNCKAVYFSNLTIDSTRKQIQVIDTKFKELSSIAKMEFEAHYQFENQFEKVFNEIIENIKR